MAAELSTKLTYGVCAPGRDKEPFQGAEAGEKRGPCVFSAMCIAPFSFSHVKFERFSLSFLLGRASREAEAALSAHPPSCLPLHARCRASIPQILSFIRKEM